MQRVDLAVVGSGFGGLVAAGLAARTGLRVSLFEAHTRPGGCAGDFALGGFWFPAGATVVTGLEPGGILRAVFDRLGVQAPSRPLDPSIRLHIDRHRVDYLAGYDDWAREFARAFPDAAPGYARFWNWARTVGGAVYRYGGRLPSFPLETPQDLLRSLRAVRPDSMLTAPFLGLTIAQVKRLVGARGTPGADALIDALLMDATGCTAADCSAVQGAIALDLYRHGCQWVDGGTGALAMKLVRAIRRDGGDVRFRSPVSGLHRRGAYWDVELVGGEVVSARSVVANVPPAVFASLAGLPDGPRVLDRDAWGAFVLHLGIDGEGLSDVHPFHQVVSTGETADPEAGSTFVSVFPGAKGNRWSISASMHTGAASWRHDDPCRRLRLERAAVDAVAAVIPDVRARIRLCRSATPHTFERFTGRPGGYVGGLRQRRGVVALLAPGHRPAPGAYLAGDHVFPGQGTVGVALSGVNAYRDVVRYLGRSALL